MNNHPAPELLEVLVAAAEARNLTEAATRLGLSQPAVSMKLKALERALPLAAFARQGKRKVLTPYGHSLYEAARAQLSAQRRAIEAVNRKYQAAEHLTLRVGARPEVFEAVADRLRFEGRIELTPLPGHESTRLLLARELDLALTQEIPDSTELVAKKLLVSGAKVLVPRATLAKARLAANERLLSNAKFFAETPALSFKKHGHLLIELWGHLGLSAAQTRVRLVAQDWRLLVTAVERGMGYTVVPSYVRSESKAVAAIAVPARVSAPVTFHALYHVGLRDVPAYRELLEGLVANRPSSR